MDKNCESVFISVILQNGDNIQFFSIYLAMFWLVTIAGA